MAIDPALRLKPVVAIDVDGVVRIHKYPGMEDDGLIPVEITMTEDEYPELFHGQPRWGESGKVTHENHFAPTAVSFIRAMIDHPNREPVWATTWQRWANHYFVEPLGLEELPVAVVTLEPRELNRYRSSPAWKSAQLSRQFDGRPLVWIDDNMPERPGEDLAERRRPIDRAITLSYRINPFLGITAEDIEEIEAWLALASTEAGQKELRVRRAKELRDQKASQLREEKRWIRGIELSKAARLRVEESFPEERRLIQELGALARDREGLTDENVTTVFTRAGVEADPIEFAAKLRVPRYHRRFAKPVDGLDLESMDF